MSPNPLSLIVPAVTFGLLVIATWEAECARREARREAEGQVALRLATWVFFLSLLFLREPPFAAESSTLPRFAVVVILGWIASLLALVVGSALGRIVAAPPVFRHLLAFYIGVAQWLQWIRWLVRWFRLRRGSREGEVSRSVDTTDHDAGVLDDVEEIRQGVRDLAAITVGEVTIPRTEVSMLDASWTARQALDRVRATPHSIYPVFEPGADQPLGVVRLIDLAGPDAETAPLRTLQQPLPLVPETTRGFQLLHRLADAPLPAAFVVDEFGNFAGFVTVEDLLEVLVGDLEGEHEIVRRRVLEDGDRVWKVEGSCRIEEFNEAAGARLPDGEYETVAGLFLDRYGRIPEAGAEVLADGVRLEVRAATSRRILWLRAEELTSEV